MNSQIFPNNAAIKANHSQSIGIMNWHSPAVHWISIIILIAIVILFPERPAWGNDVVITSAGETEVRFEIQHTIPAERAIHIIRHPFDHTVVYDGISDPLKIRIDQIQVYYENPAAPAFQPAIAQAIATVVDDAAFDWANLLTLPIAYGTEQPANG